MSWKAILALPALIVLGVVSLSGEQASQVAAQQIGAAGDAELMVSSGFAASPKQGISHPSGQRRGSLAQSLTPTPTPTTVPFRPTIEMYWLSDLATFTSDGRYIRLRVGRYGPDLFNFPVNIDYWIYVCPPYDGINDAERRRCNDEVAHPNTKEAPFNKGTGSITLEAVNNRVYHEYIKTFDAVDFQAETFAYDSYILLVFEIKTPGIGYGYEARGSKKDFSYFRCTPCNGPPPTPAPTATRTATATPTLTPIPTATAAPTATAVHTATAAPTATAVHTATATPTATAVHTVTATPTLTVTHAATAAHTATATHTATVTPTRTLTPTAVPDAALPPDAPTFTPTATSTPTITPTPTLPASAEAEDVPPSASLLAASAGAHHICWLNLVGEIACVGNDDASQASGRPVGEGFTAVSVGRSHSCALDGEGYVRCWGSDEYGQSEAPEDGGFAALGSGENFSCALHPDGGLHCWGRFEPVVLP